MTEEEDKWLFLFSKKVHHDCDDYEEGDDVPPIDSDIFRGELEKHGWTGKVFWDRFRVNEKESENIDQSLEALSLDSPPPVYEPFGIEEILKHPASESESVSDESDFKTNLTEHTDLMSFNSFLACVAEEGLVGKDIVQQFVDCVATHKDRIYLGDSFVSQKDVKTLLDTLKTPQKAVKKEKKEQTEDEVREAVKKVKQKNDNFCLEMGIEPKKKNQIPIGQL